MIAVQQLFVRSKIMLGWLKKTKLHFIGIGGIGMSGIAEILVDMGYSVSGSDLQISSVTENLEKKGAKVFLGHNQENVIEADVVIYSSAISDSNPEIQKAKELKLPLIQRADMLAELMRLKFGIAIAGSHGKTTTSSLVASIFDAAKLDATHVIGGIVSHLGGNARKGNGDFLIAEADESDGSFLKLRPIMAAVTNIDNDHLDYYGTKDKVVEAFVKFVNNLPFYGKACLNLNDVPSIEIKEAINRPAIWYGINSIEADYEARNLSLSGSGTEFDLYIKGDFKTRIKTHLLGTHNVSNTLAAIALSHEAEISLERIQQGLLDFKGVGRRLEKVYEEKEFLILDDYGHHPTEVNATLSTLMTLDQRPLSVIFELHRYSRTEKFWNEFKGALKDVPELYLLPIYGASEKEIPGVTAEKMVSELLSEGVNVRLISTLDLERIVNEKKDNKQILLTLGAGAISKNIRAVVKGL